jgi:hypothetical protein
MRVMLAAVMFDLAHLLAHPGTEHHLFVNKGNAYQITAFASQAPGYIAQKTHVGVQGWHSHFQRRTVAPRPVIIASHAPEADSVQLLP